MDRCRLAGRRDARVVLLAALLGALVALVPVGDASAAAPALQGDGATSLTINAVDSTNSVTISASGSPSHVTIALEHGAVVAVMSLVGLNARPASHALMAASLGAKGTDLVELVRRSRTAAATITWVAVPQ
jgi:hypothetical protein